MCEDVVADRRENDREKACLRELCTNVLTLNDNNDTVLDSLFNVLHGDICFMASIIK